MQQKGIKNHKTDEDANELMLLQEMSKEALIQKCLDLTLSFRKADTDLRIYNELLAKMLTENEELKKKIPHIEKKEYNSNWSWVNKIVFVLKKIKRPLLSTEIIELILPYEPTLKSSYTPAQSFSPHMHKAVKYGRVLAYKLSGSRGYYYILPEWMDADGRIIKEYEDKIYFK